MVNSGLCRGLIPSLRKLRLTSNTFGIPPTMSRLRYSSGAMRRYRSVPSALWWVTKGFAAAPPGMGCSIGVSTSTNPRSSMTSRMACMTAERMVKTRRVSSVTTRSTSRWR